MALEKLIPGNAAKISQRGLLYDLTEIDGYFRKRCWLG
jgi:hypothetical protein